jgi:CheY-like chemotaxis protein
MTLAQKTVLVVDDNPGDRHLLRTMLDTIAPGQYGLLEAWNLAQAIKHLEAGGVDLLLLDLNLPDSRGLETLSALRGADGKVPIVIITGSQDQTAVEAALAAGAQDFLVKGEFDEQHLGRILFHNR